VVRSLPDLCHYLDVPAGRLRVTAHDRFAEIVNKGK